LPAWPLPERFELKLMGKKRIHSNGLYGRAFSTLELLVILGIVAVVMSIGYPFFKQYQGNGNLRSAARGIVAGFAEQKQRAMAGDTAVGGVRIHRLALNLGANQYTLQRCTNTNNPCLSWENIDVKSLNQYGNDILFDPGETNPTNVDFQTRGTVTQATIVLTNSRGSRARIQSNISGRTHVEFDMR